MSDRTVVFRPALRNPLSAGVQIDESMRQGPPPGYWKAVTTVMDALQVSPLADTYGVREARLATADELLLAHTPEYVATVAALSRMDGGEVGPHTYVVTGGYDVAAAGAGTALDAVDAVLRGPATRAYALAFPAGHHAGPSSGGGWCVFNNVAVAVRYARNHGTERVMVIDWDVHWGNGIQEIFWTDSTVLTVSLHQDRPFEPMTGGIDAAGADAGYGRHINIPLPAGAALGAYTYAWDTLVRPAARAFRPGLILISGGVDASVLDPLARLRLHAGAFHTLAGMACDLADELCGGRLVLSHEGCYSSTYSPLCMLNMVTALAGAEPVPDPFLDRWRLSEMVDVLPHEREHVDTAARAALSRL